MMKTPLSRIVVSGTLIAALLLLPGSLQAAPAADQEEAAVSGHKLALSEIVSWLLDRWDGLWAKADPSDEPGSEPGPPQKAGCESDPDGCPESSSSSSSSGGG